MAAHGGINLSDDGLRWEMWGEIDVAVAHEVYATLEAAGEGRKTLDMRRVTFIDSSGVRLVVLACENGPHPRVVGAPQLVRDIFEMMSFDMLVDFVDADPAEPLDDATRTGTGPRG
ncbi:STAS domain-containing protein [Isoptericola sp. NPDC060257]|uniref:STAS domain-containing protein n=1 Tax=Isoptericola sp. NPDC060257 TaxID=3347087 RepID=UPI00365D9F92